MVQFNLRLDLADTEVVVAKVIDGHAVEGIIDPLQHLVALLVAEKRHLQLASLLARRLVVAKPASLRLAFQKTLDFVHGFSRIICLTVRKEQQLGKAAVFDILSDLLEGSRERPSQLSFPLLTAILEPLVQFNVVRQFVVLHEWLALVELDEDDLDVIGFHAPMCRFEFIDQLDGTLFYFLELL